MTADIILRSAGLERTSTCAVDVDEARCIDRAKAGDEAAFGWLLSRYRQRAVRTAAHILGNPNEAEDVAQEAFIRAFRGIRQLRADQAFLPWFYRIVVRLCLDRKRLARWTSEDSSAAFEHGVDTGFSGAVAERVVVEQLLRRLSPPLRAVLVLRELEGLDYDDVAQTLGIPIGTVRSRLNVARGQFRKLWTEAVGEDLDDE